MYGNNTGNYSQSVGGDRHFNLMLLFGALLGAAIGYIIGEALIFFLEDAIPDILLVGFYFALLMFCIFFAVLLCEKIDPRLNTRIWTKDHWKNQLIRLPLMSLVVFFALGCLFQFIYGLSINQSFLQNSQNYIIAIDNSGSMISNDAPKERFSAVESFMEELDETNKVSVILFSHEVQVPIPLTNVDDDLRSTIKDTLSDLEPDGGTDIELALQEASSLAIENENTMVILLSDGESYIDINKITKLYSDKHLVLNTIDFSGNRFWRNSTLLNLSTSTGGLNYQISEMNQLAGTFTKILAGTNSNRMLLDYRYGLDRNSTLYAILRILFITLLGLAMCFALGFMMYNLDVVKTMLKQKIAMALIAGIILEFGLANYMPALSARLIMAFLFGLLITFFVSEGNYSQPSNNNLAYRGNSRW